MNVCIPVNEDNGMSSTVCEHFGSAPLFLIVDTETSQHRTIPNTRQHHGHGNCQPLAVLSGHELDAIVVGGIGMGALVKLQAANLQVFRSPTGTVSETVAALAAGTLEPVTAQTACGGHRQGGHGHGQGGCHG